MANGFVDEKILPEMTGDMQKAYTDFFGNLERLRNEWILCTTQYREHVGKSISKDGSLKARLEIRKISDYWRRRRNALEYCLPPAIVKEWKKSEK